MQVALGLDHVRQTIEQAFAGVDTPAAEDIVAARFRDSIDPGELVAAFRGKHWREVPRRDLFWHRECVSMLSAVGLRAYLPAYMIASLEGEHADDLSQYTLFGLHAVTGTAEDEALARERLALLDEPQRAAVAMYLGYLAPNDSLAARILATWR